MVQLKERRPAYLFNVHAEEPVLSVKGKGHSEHHVSKPFRVEYSNCSFVFLCVQDIPVVSLICAIWIKMKMYIMYSNNISYKKHVY